MRRSFLVGLACLVLLTLSPAVASGQTTATVSIKPRAVLLAGGAVAQVTVHVRCTLEPGDELLEGLVSVSQEQAFGFGSLNPTCNGKLERIVVQVPTEEGLFEPGPATASAFLLFVDPESGNTVSAQDTRTVRLHGS